MKNTVNKVLTIVNKTKKYDNTILQNISGYFKKKNIKLETFQVGLDRDFHNHPQLLQGTDLVISLGGDGTLLYCSQLLAGKDIPILAVNLGDFGFITEVSFPEWQQVLEKYISGNIGVSSRIMLDITVKRKNKIIKTFRGLNDGVVGGGGISKILHLKVSCSGTYMGRYRADGIIIATPTGSTAYSLSAGGPILHPEMEALILCPICPFSLSHRPLVVPGKKNFEIEVEADQRTQVMLTIDGQESILLNPLDKILFTKSAHYAHIIRSDKRNFYEVLRSKLNWSGEPNA